VGARPARRSAVRGGGPVDWAESTAPWRDVRLLPPEPADPEPLLAAYPRLEELSLSGVPGIKRAGRGRHQPEHWRRPLRHAASRSRPPGFLPRWCGRSASPSCRPWSTWNSGSGSARSTAAVRTLKGRAAFQCARRRKSTTRSVAACGCSSVIQCPQSGMIASSTSSATHRNTAPISGPNVASPPKAKTGI
jgi:hypothetical protein